MSRFTGWCAVLLLVCGSAQSEQVVDESREAQRDVRIEIHGVTGQFTVIGTSDSRLAIAGRLSSDRDTLSIEGDPSSWRIEVRPPNRQRGSRPEGHSELTIRVPQGADVEITTVSGAIDMQDLAGSWVRAKSISGGITLANVRPQQLFLETISGTQRADAGGSAENRLSSVSGNIQLENAGGRIQLSTVSGNCDVQVDDVQELEAETVSGNVRARVNAQEQARLKLSSHSGDLTLTMPGHTPLDVQASTFSGSLSNDFGGSVAGGRGPGRRMEFRQAGGTVRIEARSFSGRIAIAAE